MCGLVVQRALGQHDPAGGQEVPDAVKPRLAVDVVEIVALTVGLSTGDRRQEAVKELLPGVLVHHGGGGQDAVEVKKDGGCTGERTGEAGGVGNYSHESRSFQTTGRQDGLVKAMV
ncbi:hypothetical protein SRABI128_05869 [Microbacterium sp. Bi128]|nr:hypothetical protein SRABI128_05869 [Microbacterium sp. Bi128]